MKYFSTSFLIGFFLILSLCVYAQDSDCSQTLTKAQDTYKEGRIYEIADMLQPCLSNGFSKSEKIEAYRLLTLTYLYFNERAKAEEAMTHLLQNDPEYKLRPIDPTEFVNLYNSFRTTPILLIGGKAGVNFQDINVSRNFSLDNSEVSRGSYKSGVGLQGGMQVQVPFSQKLSLLTELLFVIKSYTYSDKLFEYASLKFPEKQAYLALPVLVNYNFGTGRWVPYANIGGSIGYMLKAKAVPVRVDETTGNNQREIKEGEIDISDLRKTIHFNLIAGAGLKVKNVLGRGYLFLDVRFTYGLNNIVKPEARYSNTDLVYKYLYVDNNFKMNSFQYSLGYSYPLYKPKLKRQKKSKETVSDL